MSAEKEFFALRGKGNLTDCALRVLWYLAHCDNHGACFPSVERMAYDLEFSVRAIKDARKELEELGLIVISHDRRTTRGVGCSYELKLSHAITRRSTLRKSRCKPSEEPKQGANRGSLASLNQMGKLSAPNGEVEQRNGEVERTKWGSLASPDIKGDILKRDPKGNGSAGGASVHTANHLRDCPLEGTGEEQEVWFGSWEDRLKKDPVMALADLVGEGDNQKTVNGITGYYFQLGQKEGRDKAREKLIETGKRILSEKSCNQRPDNWASLLMSRLSKTAQGDDPWTA